MIKSLQIKSLLAAFAFLFGISTFAQVQLKQQTDFMTPIMGINSSGHGVSVFGYYDFETNAITPPEEGVGGTTAITDDETVLGMIEGSSGNYVPAVRVNGEWTALPASVPLSDEDTLYDISENGIWITGQKGWDPNTDTAWGFVYNTQTQEFRLLESTLYEYSAAYAVNNDGYAVGWVDDLAGGTLRMPAVFAPNGDIILVSEDAGEFSGISNNGVAVGYLGENGLIYDIASEGSTQILNDSSLFTNLSLTDISENGVVVGFGSMFNFDRLPIIYHPDMGSDFVLLGDFLADFDIDASNLGGAAYKVSTNGNYIGGFTDGPAFMAMGWAVYLDDFFSDEEGGEDCDQGDVSNPAGVDNGFGITLGDVYDVADDFFVSTGNTLDIKMIKLNLLAEGLINQVDITFYEDDGAGFPGDLLAQEVTAVIDASQQVQVGSAFGFNQYEVYIPVDLSFTEGHYWMAPHASYVGSGSSVYWEQTNAGSLGETVAVRNITLGEEWERDLSQSVFTLYCEEVEVPEQPDLPCNFEIEFDVEPITRVLFAGIDNVTDATLNGSPALEDFTDIDGNVEAGATYEVALEGNTNGSWTNYFTVFIKWNEDSSWTDYATYEIGSLAGSTGTDGQQVTGNISIPADAAEGAYTMRVIKSFGGSPTDPCGTYGWGQAEDYTLVVGEGGGEGDECWQGIPSVATVPNAFGITIGSNFRVAEDFTVPEDTTFTVNKLTFDINNTEVVDYAIINIREDNSGQPGAVIHTIEMEPSSWEEVGSAFGEPIYNTVFNLTDPIEFGEGVYWIDPKFSIPSGDTVWWAATDEHSDGAFPMFSGDDGASWELDGGGLSMVFTIAGHCETLGFGDVTSFDFSYYPNPVRDVLYINSGKTIENVRVFNLTGQEIISNSKVSNGQINVSALPTGVYVFRVALEHGQVETFKIIKK